MTVTPDSVYQLIKSYESQFPIPAPYVTTNVGTFDAAAGTFSGLTTTVETDPEPVAHGPNDHPRNPPPRYVGDKWVSVTIDASWRRTITQVPAPSVPLAPVLLQFAISNAATPWSATVNGVTVSAPATQNRLTVSIWDATTANWSVQAGAKSYRDTLRIQRPGNLGASAGAFTIPVLPVTLVYAPPADSLGKSAATYSQGQTVGTTVTYDFSTDTSQTVPLQTTNFAAAGDFKAFLDLIAEVGALGTGGAKVMGQIFSDISSQFGQLSSTETTGISDLSETQMTVTEAATDSISTSAKAGGPGVGDVMFFYINLRMAWAFYNGQLRVCPLGYDEEAALGVAGLVGNPGALGISAKNAQLLLGLDPFVSGGAQAALPTDRFTHQVTAEYGFGGNVDHKFVVTRDTKDQTVHKTYTTDTNDWEPGPIFKLLGLGEKDQTTVTLSNATGSDVSSTVTLDASLFSGPQESFVVGIYYDNMFGTYAFQETNPAPLARFQGSGVQPGQEVRLDAGGKVFLTVADQNGTFMFRAPTIPDGNAMLMIGDQPGQPVTISADSPPFKMG